VAAVVEVQVGIDDEVDIRAAPAEDVEDPGGRFPRRLRARRQRLADRGRIPDPGVDQDPQAAALDRLPTPGCR
jgi:hypothetical protein